MSPSLQTNIYSGTVDIDFFFFFLLRSRIFCTMISLCSLCLSISSFACMLTNNARTKEVLEKECLIFGLGSK